MTTLNNEVQEGFCRILCSEGIFEQNDIARYKYHRTMLLNLRNKKLTSILPKQRQDLQLDDMKNIDLGFGYAVSLITTPSNDSLYITCEKTDVIQVFCKMENIIHGMNWRTGAVGYYSLKNCVFLSHSLLHTYEVSNGQLLNANLRKLSRRYTTELSPVQPVSVANIVKATAASKIQRVYRKYRIRKKINGIVASMKRIREYLNLENEFYYSEAKYIEYLKIIIDLYLAPLREVQGTENEIIGRKEISAIFGNVETILKLNEELYKEFMKAKVLGKKHLADVLLHLLPYLKMYITFISGYEQSSKQIAELSKTNKEFKELLIRGKEHPRSQEDNKSEPLGLRELMPKPLQRIFAYNNMLQRMAELVPSDARAYENIMKVKEEMEKTVKWVNEEKKKIEHANTVALKSKKKTQGLFSILGVKAKLSQISPKHKDAEHVVFKQLTQH